MKSRIIITGASGFIGSAIVAELILRGHHVIALVRPDSDLSRLHEYSQCQIVSCASLAGVEARSALGQYKPDVFVHCAWRGVGGADRNSSWQITDNLRLTLDALELAKALGCGYWLSLGSQAEYGNGNCRMSEASPTTPTTLYGRAKLIAGQAALAYCDAEGMAGSVLRVFSTYGPGDSPSWFIPYIIQEFLNGRSPSLTRCEQIWDYLYVTDAARAVALVLEKRAAGVFNLGSGSVQPLRNIVEAIRDELMTANEAKYGAVAYRADQVMHLEADVSLLTQAVGWTPSVPFNVGLESTIAFEKRRHKIKLISDINNG